MNYINLLELEIKINDCLCTIKQSLEHVCYYLMNDDCNLEKEDIIFELSDADCQKIKEFAKKHNKKIVTIGSYQKCTDIFIPAHPLEVLPYFKKADFVITDTFHGTIFSVKAHVPFVTKLKTYNTEKLSYLIESLKFANREILSYD